MSNGVRIVLGVLFLILGAVCAYIGLNGGGTFSYVGAVLVFAVGIMYLVNAATSKKVNKDDEDEE